MEGTQGLITEFTVQEGLGPKVTVITKKIGAGQESGLEQPQAVINAKGTPGAPGMHLRFPFGCTFSGSL